MLVRYFFFLLGFGLTVVGFMYIIIYLNLLSIGYNFLQYVKFICSRLECLNALFGIIIMVLVVIMSGGKKNELCLWCFTKF